VLVRNHTLGIHTTELENAKQTILVERVPLLKVHTWRRHPFWKSLVTVDFYHNMGARNLGCCVASTKISVNSLKRISLCDFWDNVLGNSDSEVLHQKGKREKNFFSRS